MQYHTAVMMACGIIIFSALNSIIFNHIYHISFHIGLKLRVAVCSLIYRKALRLSQTALGETSPGKMVNLLTNDVNRFHWAIFFVNSLWVSPLLTVIVGVLLWFEVGIPGLIGIAVVFAVVPLLSMSFISCSHHIDRIENKIISSTVRLRRETNISVSFENRTKNG